MGDLAVRSSLVVCALWASVAAGQPAPLDARTGGLLVGDQDLDGVYLTRDVNGDGDAVDAAERTVWFDGTNASGLPSPTADVFTIFQSASGWVFLGEGSTDSVYRVRDVDGDGDANDAGEAGVWFSGAGNAAGYPLLTPGGVWETADGAVFILTPGTLSTPGDAIYRTVDLNGDGDAQDAGEATLWMDLETLYASSSAFELVFIGETAYFTDLRGGETDAIMRARDADGDGSIEAGEFGVFLEAGNAYGAPVGFALKTDGVSLYVVTNLASAAQTVFRLTDLDASGAIDSAAEAAPVWDEGSLPAGAELGSAFTLAVGPGGEVSVGSSGSGAADGVLRLVDGDADGSFTDTGETTVWIDAGGTLPASRVRAVEYILPAGCAGDFNGDGQLSVADFTNFRDAYLAGDMAADYSGNGSLDVSDFTAFRNAYLAGCP